jgi:hypothetical protein
MDLARVGECCTDGLSARGPSEGPRTDDLMCLTNSARATSCRSTLQLVSVPRRPSPGMTRRPTYRRSHARAGSHARPLRWVAPADALSAISPHLSARVILEGAPPGRMYWANLESARC